MSDATAEEKPEPSRIAIENWIVYGLFGGLTLAGIVISMEPFGPEIVTDVPPSDGADRLSVPLFVYVYATLGALGYVFTKLMSGLEDYDEPREIRGIVEMGMRVPAAWILAAGFYVILLQTGNNPSDAPELFAATAFLIGLYVNVALKSLGGFADRMLGRGRSE